MKERMREREGDFFSSANSSGTPCAEKLFWNNFGVRFVLKANTLLSTLLRYEVRLTVETPALLRNIVF